MVDLYFFDLDKTLYAYDFRQRLPELSRVSGVSEYRLAESWWAGGWERKAEAGAFRTTEEYLARFERVTGAHISFDEWITARALAMTPIPGSIAALRRASGLGTVSLLSNNPAPLAEALPVLAPDVAEILGPNVLVSYMLGARKPSKRLYRRALAHYGARPQDALLVDDSEENIRGAASIGMHVHHFRSTDGAPAIAALDRAIDEFAARARSA